MACSIPFVLVRKDPFPHVIPVPCGKCQACRRDNITMWADRVGFEVLTTSKPSGFLTLTYDEAHMPYHRSADISQWQTFVKRLRSNLSRCGYNQPIKYAMASEYGEKNTFRLHYHACMIGLDPSDIDVIQSISKAWSDSDGNRYGIFTFSPLTSARIRYCIEYISYDNPALRKVWRALGFSDPVHSFSKGIAVDWIKSHADMIRETNGYYSNGVLRPIPRYFKEKLGMVDKGSYVERLNEIWSPYNKLLASVGAPTVDPYDYASVCKSGLLNHVSADCKLSVLQLHIGKFANERLLAHKALIKMAKRS